MVMDTRGMGMIGKTEVIAADPTHVATHGHAADMNASAEAAQVRTAADTAKVRASSETAHVSATAETSAVTATTSASAVTAATSASAAAPRIRRADSQCGGKRGHCQDHHHSFHQDAPSL
ncbi:septal ring-binding cell division protein DamX [Bradyrhizobium sp. F1.13.1]